jgi:antitoxin (DNA-binding transcriptional repressor) of toxin-antitoxin stability system
MEKATISELKNRLSAYLQKVRAGETVLVLDRDRPIARIERVTTDTGHDDRLRRLERAGIVRRSAAPLPLAALRAGTARASKSVVRALLDDRAGGR